MIGYAILNQIMMKQIKLILLIVVAAYFMYSCAPTRVYTTGSYGSIKSYTEKQHYVNAKSTATYISGDVSFGRHPQDAESFNDTKTITAINIHRNTTGRCYNFYYGLGAAFGSYKFKEGYQDFIDKGEKSKFYTVNLKSGINYTYTRPKVDWRFIGVEFAYLNESGAYQDKLSELSSVIDSDLIVVNLKSMFTYQLYSEYVFKISNKEAITLGFYVGDLINRKDAKKALMDYNDAEIYDTTTGFNGFAFGVRFNKYSLSAIFETGQGDIKSTKIGLTYKL